MVLSSAESAANDFYCALGMLQTDTFRHLQDNNTLASPHARQNPELDVNSALGESTPRRGLLTLHSFPLHPSRCTPRCDESVATAPAWCWLPPAFTLGHHDTESVVTTCSRRDSERTGSTTPRRQETMAHLATVATCLYKRDLRCPIQLASALYMWACKELQRRERCVHLPMCIHGQRLTTSGVMVPFRLMVPSTTSRMTEGCQQRIHRG